MKYLTYLLILASVATFLLAGYYFVESWRLTLHSVHTKGQISNFISQPSQNTNLHPNEVINYPVISFQTPQGATFTFTSKSSFYPHNYQIGDKIDVLYHPHDPRHAAMGNYISIWLRFVLVLLAAWLFAVLACISSSIHK